MRAQSHQGHSWLDSFGFTKRKYAQILEPWISDGTLRLAFCSTLSGLWREDPNQRFCLGSSRTLGRLGFSLEIKKLADGSAFARIESWLGRIHLIGEIFWGWALLFALIFLKFFLWNCRLVQILRRWTFFAVLKFDQIQGMSLVTLVHCRNFPFFIQYYFWFLFQQYQ